MRIIICDDDMELAQQLKIILEEFFERDSIRVPEIVIYNNIMAKICSMMLKIRILFFWT